MFNVVYCFQSIFSISCLLCAIKNAFFAFEKKLTKLYKIFTWVNLHTIAKIKCTIGIMVVSRIGFAAKGNRFSD